MLKLKSINLRNWGSVQEAELHFPEKGLVFVTGKNTVSQGRFDSIGSGKTLLGEAICRAALGVPGRYNKISAYSPTEKGNLFIRLNAEIHGSPLVIEQGYRCNELSKTGEALRWQAGGQWVQRATIQETRASLTDLVRISARSAAWTVMIDGSKLNFADLSEQDAVTLIMETLDQPPWNQYHEKAKKAARTFAEDLLTENGSYNQLKYNLMREQENLPKLQQKLQAAHEQVAHERAAAQRQAEQIQQQKSAIREKISSYEGAVAQLKQQIQTAEQEEAHKYSQLEQQRGVLQSQITQMRAQSTQHSLAVGEARSELNLVKKTLHEMQQTPTVCSKCGKPWDAAHSAVELAAAEKDVQEKSAIYDQVQSELSSWTSKILTEQKKIDQIETELRQLKSSSNVSAWSRKIETLTQEILNSQKQLISLERAVNETKVDETAILMAEKELANCEARIAEAAQQEQAGATALAAAQTAKAAAEYWVEAYSPTGIPNLVLKETIEPLNRVSKNISFSVSGGILEIQYATSRVLNNGKEKNEISMQVVNKNGSSNALGGSKGESGLINLIAAETFAEVGLVPARIGFRWYDEVATSQDPSVRRAIFAYLKETARRLGILIFVVDHSPEVASYADYTLIAEKTAEGTKYIWK